MKVITRQLLANGAADSWGHQYSEKDSMIFSKQREQLVLLKALGPTPDPDEVDKVIGNKGWTRMACDECGEGRDVVELGEEPDYESATAHICKPCLEQAIKMIDKQAKGEGR